MRFNILHAQDGWRWNLAARNGKVICSGEAYEKPQKLVQTVEKYIVRDDPDLAVALEKALHKMGFDEHGGNLS